MSQSQTIIEYWTILSISLWSFRCYRQNLFFFLLKFGPLNDNEKESYGPFFSSFLCFLSSTAPSRSRCRAFAFCLVSSFHSRSPQEILILPLLAGQFFLIFNAKLFPSYSFLTTSPRHRGSYASLKVAYRTGGDWYSPVLKSKHSDCIFWCVCVLFSVWDWALLKKIQRRLTLVDSVMNWIWQKNLFMLL